MTLIAVVGAHLDGQPLNHQLTDRGATFVARTETAPIYRLYALPTDPPKPGLVRVVDGCGFNDHFWVFAASSTDVEYTLTVTDTLSGEVQELFSPLTSVFDPIQDTRAFATCP